MTGESEIGAADLADLAALGLSAGADDKAIRAAYRRLAIEHHPDRGGSHATMSRINEAFDRLTTAKPVPPVTAGPPVWRPPRHFEDHEAARTTRRFASIVPIARTMLSAAAIPILIVLPAATVVVFLYVVGKILF